MHSWMPPTAPTWCGNLQRQEEGNKTGRLGTGTAERRKSRRRRSNSRRVEGVEAARNMESRQRKACSSCWRGKRRSRGKQARQKEGRRAGSLQRTRPAADVFIGIYLAHSALQSCRKLWQFIVAHALRCRWRHLAVALDRRRLRAARTKAKPQQDSPQ